MVLSPEQDAIFKQRLEKLEALRALGVEIYPSTYQRTLLTAQIQDRYQSLEKGESTSDTARVSGRVMAYRNSGLFLDLQDDSGKIQIFCKEPTLQPLSIQIRDLLDLGDFIGVEGTIRRTPRGEITLDAQEITFLSKALLPLPDKYHGLSDRESRYRQRYVDLIANETSRDILRKRATLIRSLRQVMEEKGFLEVETPMLQPIPGGAIARPFVTHHNALDTDLYLRIAPELYLKRLIVGGLSEKVFEINRCFRNEGISTRHNPEFTTIEVYQAYVGFEAMMTLTEDLVIQTVQRIWGTEKGTFGDHTLNFSGPWPRKSMATLVFEKTGVDFLSLQTDEEARLAAQKLSVPLPQQGGWGKILEAVFAEKVESSLIQPIHVTHHPVETSPLAKVLSSDPRLTERFETYINGWEIANGFSELNDPIDQKARFMAQGEAKKAGDAEAHEMDTDFITALSYALPPTGGMGMGIDRLAMLLTNASSIREVIAFPTLKPK